jgi:hypothetical protein
MRLSIYRDGSNYFLRPQFTADEIAYLKGTPGPTMNDRDRIAFHGDLKSGLTLWVQSDDGYKIRPSAAPRGQFESRIPCAQVKGPSWTLVTQDVRTTAITRNGKPAIFVPSQFPFDGSTHRTTEPFNPLTLKKPLHWDAPSGKDDMVKIVPPHSKPQPAEAEADVARTEGYDEAGTGAAAAELQVGLKGPLREPPPPAAAATETQETPKIPFGREELLKVPPGYGKILPRPVVPSLSDARKALKEAIELVNACVEDCGDDIVLKIDGNRVKASVLVVQEIEL